MTATLSLSSSLELIAGFVICFILVALFAWMDYHRLCETLPPRDRDANAADLGAEIHAYKMARDAEDAKEWRPGERKVGPPSRTHIARKP